MDEANRGSVIAFGVGAAALAAASIAALLIRTRGEPAARRVGLMARLAWSAVWSVLPSRRSVAGVVAGALTSAVSLAVGLVATVLIVRGIPPDVPNPTEAYEGFGDAARAMFLFWVGAALSECAAIVTELVVGAWVASRTPEARAEPAVS